MTFSGCRAATRPLERCFILLDFKIYNVFLPMNVSTLTYKVFPTFQYIWFGQNVTRTVALQTELDRNGPKWTEMSRNGPKLSFSYD